MARAMIVGVVSFLMLGGFAAQAEVVKTYELAGSYGSLSETISTTDLIHGFPSDEDGDGLPLNQGLNESAVAPYADGVVDMDWETWEPLLVSWLMNGWDDCLPVNEYQASDGFHYVVTDPTHKLPSFTDGTFNPAGISGLLRDHGRAALIVRYGFEDPVDIGAIRVFGGNMNNNDGRVFQHYDVYARQGDCADGTCPAHGAYPNLIGFDEFFMVAEEVKSGDFGLCNCDEFGGEGPWQVSMTNVSMELDDKPLIKGCTDLRIVFYCVSNTGKMFLDELQGNENEPEDYQLQCSAVEEGDSDGWKKAFEAGIIKEIDVLPPHPTRWGDIDADGDRDLFDFAAMQGCYGEDVNSNGCYRFDFNEDEAVDELDVEGFVNILTGP